MSSKPKKVITYVFLIVVSIISIFPIAWMVIAATNKSVEVIAGKLTPGMNLIENYRNLISQQPL